MAGYWGPAQQPFCRAGPVCPAGGRGTEVTDCHTSDIGHWLAMTHCKECVGADVGIGPYEVFTDRIS